MDADGNVGDFLEFAFEMKRVKAKKYPQLHKNEKASKTREPFFIGQALGQAGS